MISLRATTINNSTTLNGDLFKDQFRQNSSTKRSRIYDEYDYSHFNYVNELMNQSFVETILEVGDEYYEDMLGEYDGNQEVYEDLQENSKEPKENYDEYQKDYKTGQEVYQPKYNELLKFSEESKNATEVTKLSGIQNQNHGNKETSAENLHRKYSMNENIEVVEVIGEDLFDKKENDSKPINRETQHVSNVKKKMKNIENETFVKGFRLTMNNTGSVPVLSPLNLLIIYTSIYLHC